MFVDVNAPLQIFDPLLLVIASALGEPNTITRVQQGVYITPLNHGLPCSNRYPDINSDTDRGYLPPYGVVDTVEQFLEFFGDEIENAPRSFYVTFTEFRKDQQPEDGGWRWHKWGEYLGTKNPQYEYLYDEGPEIESVFVYHIYETDQISLDDLRDAVSKSRPLPEGATLTAMADRVREADEQPQ